jgi:hypothetical protein
MIYLQPQVCCTRVEFANRSDAWWSSWFDQYENFLRVHARIAREEGADAFSFSAPQESLPGNRAPAFAGERWDRLWAAAKESNMPVGFSFHTLPPDERPQLLWPQEATNFYGKMDFIALAMWNHLSDRDFPTQQELDAGYDRIFRDVDYNYNISRKPFVLAQIAYFSEIGAAKQKGPEEFPSWEDPGLHRESYDARTQAMIYESLMKHIADRPYVQGAFPFGYYYAAAPLNLDSDIRAKPAEAVFTSWLERLG